jgi:hypothetical protein
MTDTPTSSDSTEGAAVEIKQAHIDSLAQKLDSLELKPEEMLLLSAIVGTAARVVKVAEIKDPPPFYEQFAAAFTEEGANILVARFPSHIGVVETD